MTELTIAVGYPAAKRVLRGLTVDEQRARDVVLHDAIGQGKVALVVDPTAVRAEPRGDSRVWRLTVLDGNAGDRDIDVGHDLEDAIDLAAVDDESCRHRHR